MRQDGFGKIMFLLMASIIGLALLVPLLGTSPLLAGRQIQYRTVVLPFPPPPNLIQSKLTEYGNEGWELVAVIPQSGMLIFKQ
ncbi:MAG: hypothetical protein C4293_13010 [Nitrospiraceae bacterium]